MRTRCLYLAAAVVIAALNIMSPHAQAFPMTARASVAAAAEAVDLQDQVRLRCRRVMQCTPSGCFWQRSCLRVCPGGYSCAPLYGAYGPYGGREYWGAYTFTGWGHRY